MIGLARGTVKIVPYNHKWKNHICFRDYLRLNTESVEEYSRLKKELATKYEDDRIKYTSAKNEFISSVLKKAKQL